jgi:hypothetical protein
MKNKNTGIQRREVLKHLGLGTAAMSLFGGTTLAASNGLKETPSYAKGMAPSLSKA